MTTFKWTVTFLLIFTPLMLLLAQYGVHNAAKADAETATRQAALYSLKKGIQKGSLRDADINPQYVSIEYDQLAANEAFEESMTYLQTDNNSEKMYVINVAERDESIGISKQPPMVAIRSNVVRESLLHTFLSRFFSVESRYVIQTEKVAILEFKDTY